MSLFFGRQSKRGLGDSATQIVPPRSTAKGPGSLTPTEGMRHSAVWASLRIRAGLLSSVPLNQYRTSGGLDVPMPKSQLLLKPGALFVGGGLSTVDEWLYATQVDLDRYGNTFGIIADRDSLMRPTRIDLVDAGTVTVQVRAGKVTYKIGSQTYDPLEVWHERQYVVAGSPIGLSPLYLAAFAMLQYLSAQAFAQQWFSAAGVPSSIMKNTERELTTTQAADIKARTKATLASGDVLVIGSDWDYEMVAVPANQAQFIEAQQFSIADIARFFDLPGDMIDAPVAGKPVTYANLSQRMLQFLIVHFGPAVHRRERALSEALPQPQFARFDTDSLLRMDPLQRMQVLALQIDKRIRTPNEARAMDNLPPLTPEQEAEIGRLLGKAAPTPIVMPGDPANPPPDDPADPADPTAGK